LKAILEAPPLTNFDRDNALFHIKGYRGCFAKDALPRKIKSREYSVGNLDNSGNPGTHWVAVVNDPKCEYVEYFDPFGVMPSTEIHRYMKTAGKDIRYNDNQLQDIYSVRCGYFCCHYITERAKGKQPLDVLYALTQTPSAYNENIIL
jgi:hypothetical protein